MRRVLAVTTAALLTAALLSACDADVERADPGDLIEAHDRFPTGTESTVALPVGTIDIISTPLLDDLDVADGVPENAPAAPKGGGFIGIALTFDDAAAPPILSLTKPPGDAQVATLTLVVGDDRYPVETPYDVRPARGSGVFRDPAKASNTFGQGMEYFAVASRPDDISLDVEYDGVVQSVDVSSGDLTPGDAAGMYEASANHGPQPEQSCGTTEPAGPWPRVGFDSLECTIPEAVVVPYTAELGWAPPGRGWAIVSARTQLRGPLGWYSSSDDIEPVTNYRTATFESEVRLNGRVPDAMVATDPAATPLDDTASDQRRTYTWQVGAGDPLLLTVREAFVGTTPAYPDRPAPKDVRVSFEKTITLTL